MVTRKPVGPPVNTSATSPKSKGPSHNPPYPTTPTTTELDRAKTIHSAKSVYSPDLHTSPAFDLIDMEQARARPRRDSDASSHGTWDTDREEEEEGEGGNKKDTTTTPEDDDVDVPKPLRTRPSQQDVQQQAQAQEQEGLPAALRPGPSGTRAPRKSLEGMRYEEEANANPWASPIDGQQQPPRPVDPASNNPYRPQNGYAPETRQAAWREQRPPQPVGAPPAPPVELPTVHTPAEELSKMSLGGQPANTRIPPYETAEILAVPLQRRAPPASVMEQNQQDANVSFGTNNPWNLPSQEEHASAAPAVAPPVAPPKAPIQPVAEPEYQPPPGPPPSHAAPVASLIDHPEPAVPVPPAAGPSQPRPAPAPISTTQLPPYPSKDSLPETPQTRDKRQRSESYSIKHVSWFDATYTLDPRFKDKMRRSPILTQNANGPCPLLALVNALVLSTPQNVDSALVETLRTRETVSLGLLLDAVFEELMSGRRGNNAEDLPDVGELYAFLLALHAGMNVNPRFITPASAPRGSLDSPPPEKAPLHPVERAQSKAGCFEETREMRLYSTFNVPLIHGWTAPRNSPAYAAFERTAQTFDEWLIVQFREEELEIKLRSEGLTMDEQQLLQDIHTIKSFLNTWPTQLTEYGLETISASLGPGQIAILFRNDHFSTVYKEPRHGALMTLVTDAGYSSHDEIVWESLVDVSGAASELFSGDFRVVSHNQDVLNTDNSGGGEDGWETVKSKNRYRPHDQRSSNREGPLRVANGNDSDGHEAPPPLPGPRPTSDVGDLGVQPHEQRSASEQEDHDLALALQLQEEEEAQQRQAKERRRREQELSERFLSNESAEGPRPPIPPRRSAGNTTSSPANTSANNVPVSVTGRGTPAGRPGVNRRNDDPDAPPSYEQSASDRPYRPAGSTAAAGLQQGNPLNAYDALRRQQSAYAQNSSTTVNSTGSGGGGQGHGRRQSQAQTNGNRIRRRSSQMVGLGGPNGPGGPGRLAAPGACGSGMVGGGGGPGGPGGRGQGVQGAAGVREAEDKCAVM
jgi:ubiquitin carboxyl-terminal hydrolase MINDY-1/2